MADGSVFSTWSQRRQLSLVMQTEASECALACLAMVARYHGHDADLPSLRRRFTTSLKGIKLGRLVEIARTMGFEARPLRTELEYLSSAQTPCILHWDLNHFVVLHRVTGRGVEIYDPARGKQVVSLSEASKHFTGVLLELRPGASFEPVRERQHVSLRALTGRIDGLGKVLTQVVGLAFAIEVLALAMPFQMQWVIDQVLVTGDKNLLVVMTAGFLIAMGLSTGLALARAWIISWLGATVSSQWVTNLFAHLLKLPLDYFEKRHMGDILSRFTSIQFIQNTLTGSFVEALLDGVMGTLALLILFLYSAPLTLLVTGVFLVYSALRWAMYRTLRVTNEEQLIYTARQQSELMESVRGIQAIKLANKQAERHGRLSNATIEASRRTMCSQRITLAFTVINQGLFGTQRIILIAIGAYLAMNGRFSAGMLVAFITYADQFSTKMGGLVDKLVELRMLRLHAERIADVAFAEPERHVQAGYSGPDPEPRIEVRNLGFRYSDSDPWVLRDLSFTIGAGESVAIVGPSGCGKSTLAKLLMGLLEPSEGQIEVDGIDIRKYGLDNFRRMVGAVMQDDNLFAGTIADNIAMFDPDADMHDVVAAARLAEIHEDVVAMPMAYESTVGDMGSALSGGQKQRLILARALYRKPRLLMLDEATSHLDQERELIITARIKAMNVTRILVAHRHETIASADRVIALAAAA